ncbi:MAG: hypothetical protein EBT22_02145, partial [Chloroflexi bacterium]|nr:hypothetical protein [Chloroflexota bacterium]
MILWNGSSSGSVASCNFGDPDALPAMGKSGSYPRAFHVPKRDRDRCVQMSQGKAQTGSFASLPGTGEEFCDAGGSRGN